MEARGWYDSVSSVTKETKAEISRVVLNAYQQEALASSEG